MLKIPSDFVNYKSTSTFTKESVPKMFLHLHNTRACVYGKIVVTSGELKFYGFKERRGKIEKEVLIKKNESVISPPEYWHKVEFMSDDTEFYVDFYAQQDSDIVVENRSERND